MLQFHSKKGRRIAFHLRQEEDLLIDAAEAFSDGRTARCVMLAEQAQAHRERAERLALVRRRFGLINRLIRLAKSESIRAWARGIQAKALQLYRRGDVQSALQTLRSHPRPLGT